MDIRQLKYFIAVAQEGNIGRAAARLHISQPPLTRQIQQIEEALDVSLFTRTPKGMELTDAGELFLVEAQNVISVMEQATERTQRAGKGKLGRLDVAIFGSGILDSIPKMLLAFREAYPEVKVVLHTMGKSEQIEALRQRRVIVGFNRLLEPEPDIVSEVVTSENLFLAVNDNHPLAMQEIISFKELAHHPMVMFPSTSRPNFIDLVFDLCKSQGFTPKVSQEVGDAVTGVALVASGFGVCLVPKSATTLTLPGVSYRKLAHLPVNARVDLSCIYRVNDQSPILRAFLEIVRNKETWDSRTLEPAQ